MTLSCPSCRKALQRVKTPWGVVYACFACEGRMVGLSVLRRDRAARPFMAALWQRARAAWESRRYQRPGGRECPHCGQAMIEVGMPEELGGVELDVCVRCHSTWFDPAEYKAIPHAPAPRDEAAVRAAARPRDRRAREAAARMALEHVKAVQEPREAGVTRGPDEAWKLLPAIFGMPVECSVPPLRSRPLATWTLAGLIALVFLATLGNLGEIVREWGFVPRVWARRGGATLLSSFFLHAGWLHLVGNLYFLVVFGDNVEDRLGRGKYLLLVLAAHLAGSALHAMLDPGGSIPCIGASGGISGIVAFYAVAFPRARLAFLFFYGRWLRVPAWLMLGFYTVLQIVGARAQMAGLSNVSSLAHLGGLAVGVAAALALRARAPRVKLLA